MSRPPCAHCGRAPTPEGHDACLGALPGVTAACCGHGVVGGHGYILFDDGTHIVFNALGVVTRKFPPISYFRERGLLPECRCARAWLNMGGHEAGCPAGPSPSTSRPL